MLQIFATMFFSVLAMAAAAMLLEMLVAGWPDMRRALGLIDRTTALPRRRVAGRVRPVRKTPRVAPQAGLRAAA